jgi:hypothetical protein
VIWLISLGVSAHHGSELLVGWQWMNRLSRLGPLTGLVSKVFDSPEFLDQETRSRIHFIDTKPADADEINRRHVLHSYRFWKGVRAHLQQHAKPEDVVVIVSPAAAWFLPWIVGLPIPRDRVYYGPIGPVRLGERIDPRAPRTAIRDLATMGAGLVWRVLAPVLPQRISLRYPASWFERLIGSRFSIINTLPEVEPSTQITGQGFDREPLHWLVLFDQRHRKNVAANLIYAAAGAAASGRELVVVGATPELLVAACPELSKELGRIRCVPRMQRTDFLNWLEVYRPEIVNLSLSEGVPSTLLEALTLGCRLHVYDVGGIAWLIQAAQHHVVRHHHGRPVHEVAWGVHSLENFRDDASSRFQQVVSEICALNSSSS